MGDGESVVECFPEYIVYRDKYISDSVITFTSSCIKIKALAGTFVFELAVDDIINIESHCCEFLDFAMVNIRLISNGTSGIVEDLSFLIAQDWYEKQKAITSFAVYKSLWKVSDMGTDAKAFLGRDGAYFPVFDEHFEDVIYPKGDPDAVSISKRDVDVLQPDRFVNDTIIDFYIKYLKEKIEPGEKHRLHFFNSFFFRKLADLDKNPSSDVQGRDAYQRVRKWTRKINLFDKDYVFIPVNFNLHWSLIVICHPGEIAAFQDVDPVKSPKVPCILHLDSIRGSHSGLEDLFRGYLLEEWKGRHKETPQDISSRFLNLRFLSLEPPQQQNMSDCGLFLLHYVELFLEEIPVNFNPFKISKFSTFLTANWFQPSEVSVKRSCIMQLIYDLLDKGSHGTSTDGRSDEIKNCPSNRSRSLLPTPLRSPQCASDYGLVSRQPLGPNDAVGSFYQDFQQAVPFDAYENGMPLTEGEVASGMHFGYFPSAENTLESLSTGFEGEPSWNPNMLERLSTGFEGEPSWNPGSTV